MAEFMQGGINAGMITNTNVSYTKPTSGQVLKYNATTDLWEPGTDASSTDATQLQGVDICTTTPPDGQVLTYDLASTEWCPATAGGGGKIVQVVSGTHEFYYGMSNNWQTVGEYVSITPTSATNKLVGTMSLSSAGNNAVQNEYAINLYRDTSPAVAGINPPPGTQIFNNTTWPDGVQVWEDLDGNNQTSQNFLCLNFMDDSYATTSTLYYNIAQRHISNSYPAYIVNNPWHWFIMEVDES